MTVRPGSLSEAPPDTLRIYGNLSLLEMAPRYRKRFGLPDLTKP